MASNTEKLQEILDECIDRVIAGESVMQVLADYPPEISSELEPLLETALTAKEAAASAMPRPAFKAQSKERFLAQVRATQQAQAQRRWHLPDLFGWTRQWAVAAAAILMVMIIGGGGTVMASADSMPDDFLYPVKTFIEDVRMSLAGSDMAKAELAAKFADERMEEIAQMAEEGKTDKVEKAAERLADHLERIEKTVARKTADDDLTAEDVAKLKARIINYTTEHPLIVAAALEQAPASTRLKVQTILDDSEDRYTNAVEQINSAIQVRLAQPVETKIVSGIVRRTTDGKWLIGDEVINIDKNTVIDGVPSVGAMAQATVQVRPDGTLLAKLVRVRAINRSAATDDSGIRETSPSVDSDTGVSVDSGRNISQAQSADEVDPIRKATFSGEIRRIGDTHWVIGNRSIRITEGTVIEGDPQVRDTVRVNILIFADGSLEAAKIAVESASSMPETDVRSDEGSTERPSQVNPNGGRPTENATQKPTDTPDTRSRSGTGEIIRTPSATTSSIDGSDSSNVRDDMVNSLTR